ncbi:MAG: high frequency lysogenization protein HflD [Gammaproteobacteria bacterium]
MSSKVNFDEKNAALAFSGILLALKLVQQTAYGKSVDQQAMEASIESLFSLESSNLNDVYGDFSRLSSGLSLIAPQLNAKGSQPDMELSRYLITLLHLERKLMKNPKMLTALRQGIQNTQEKTAHFPAMHENILASLAETYATTISTLQPRIMVAGNENRLSDQRVGNQIRALLLAGMRSTVLWRQLGGTRLRLLFFRGRYVDYAQAWLAKLS